MGLMLLQSLLLCAVSAAPFYTPAESGLQPPKPAFDMTAPDPQPPAARINVASTSDVPTPALTPSCIVDAEGNGALPPGASACIGGFACGGSECDGIDMPPSAPPQQFVHSESCSWSRPMRIVMVHTGKTAGSSLTTALKNANINWTVVHAGLLSDSDSVINQLVEDYDVYIVPTREPVSRMLSAFNWLHFDGGGNWEGFNGRMLPLQAEINSTRIADALADLLVPARNQSVLGALSDCFDQLPGGANAFAESLVSTNHSSCSEIARRAIKESTSGSGHIAKGYAWYFTKMPTLSTTLLDSIRRPSKHVFHVSQENFDADLAGMFDWLCVKQPNVSTADKTAPSSERALARHDDTILSSAGTVALQALLADEYYVLGVLGSLTENKLSSAITGLPTTNSSSQ